MALKRALTVFVKEQVWQHLADDACVRLKFLSHNETSLLRNCKCHLSCKQHAFFISPAPDVSMADLGVQLNMLTRFPSLILKSRHFTKPVHIDTGFRFQSRA